MRALRTRMARLRDEQAGFTLIELMVAAALLAVVLAAVLSLLDTSAKLAPQDQERGHAIREAQVGLRRMTVELRSAYQLTTTNPYVLTAKVYTRGNDKTVTYDCSGAAANPAWGQCIRTLGGVSAPIVQAILNTPTSGLAPVFTYTARADGRITYVKIHTEVPVRASSAGKYAYRVPLDDGVYLRNLDG